MRSSSSTAYLSQVINHPNVDVLLNTQVTRLLNVATNGSTPDLRQVEFSQNANGNISIYQT